MATSNQPDAPGTDIVKQDEPRAGYLTPAQKAAIAERSSKARMAAQIRGTMWGKDLDHNTALAIGAYAARYNIDAVRHIELLGGRVYLNATYYQEEGAKLIAAGLVDRIQVEHIEADPRLDEAYLEGIKFADDARKRSDEPEAAFWTAEASAARRAIAYRRNLRIRLGAKDKAAAVVLVTIHIPQLSDPIEGWNECGNGVRKGDPVGDDRPALTAETRAARRAWKQLATVIPAEQSRMVQAADEGVELSEVVSAATARVAAEQPPPGRALVTSGATGSAYDDAAAPRALSAGSAPVVEEFQDDRDLEELALGDRPKSTDALRNG